MFDLILDSVEDFHTVEERRLHRIFGGLPGFVYQVAAWKNEGVEVLTSAPLTYLFLKMPVLGAQNKAFRKKKCRANLTGHEKRRDR